MNPESQANADQQKIRKQGWLLRYYFWILSIVGSILVLALLILTLIAQHNNTHCAQNYWELRSTLFFIIIICAISLFVIGIITGVRHIKQHRKVIGFSAIRFFIFSVSFLVVSILIIFNLGGIPPIY